MRKDRILQQAPPHMNPGYVTYLTKLLITTLLPTQPVILNYYMEFFLILHFHQNLRQQKTSYL